MQVLGVDVGGSGIKAAVVDVVSGTLSCDRQRVDTPAPATPEKIAAAICDLAKRLDCDGAMGCGLPTVVIDGKATTSGNLDPSWRGAKIGELLNAKCGREVTVLNDADAAGIAEMRFGAGVGLTGLVITITLGTGIGSGVFYNGQLIPNFELGRVLGKDGEPIERYAGARARKRDNIDWPEYGDRLDFFLQHIVRICSPDHLIIGGGISGKFDKYADRLTIDTPVHVARFLNDAGIIGAAIAAYEGFGQASK